MSVVSAKIALYKYSFFPFLSFVNPEIVITNVSHVNQGIHRHQTPPRYRNAASGSRLNLKVSLLGIAMRPITAKRDVIHKTEST